MKTNVAFFFKHAGYSYDPKTETPYEGRLRSARLLTLAEKKAKSHSWSFRWTPDYDTLSSDWVEDNKDGGKNRNPWHTWGCIAYDDESKIVGSLWGIDFGRNGEPWGHTYRRVVEAELALEYFGGTL